MIKYLVENGYADERVANAMKRVPRILFVPEIYKQHAYADSPLPISGGQTISAPSIVALMTTQLDVKENMKVLEIGAGSGYQTAIIAELIGPNGIIYSVERIPELIELSKRNIESLGFKNVRIIYGDGTLGYKDGAPYDRIIVTAGAPQIPPPLLEQLKVNGKMIIPVGPMFWQDLLLIEKTEKNEIKETKLLPVMFVPLVGKYGYKE